VDVAQVVEAPPAAPAPVAVAAVAAPAPAAPVEVASLPKTASNLSLIGLCGMMLLGAGFLLPMLSRSPSNSATRSLQATLPAIRVGRDRQKDEAVREAPPRSRARWCTMADSLWLVSEDCKGRVQMTRWTASVKHIEKGSVLSVAEIARTRRHIKSKFKYLLFFPLALAAFVCFTRIASSQDSSPLRNTPSGNYTIRMNTNLVVLSATVIDHHNMPVSGLTKDDFQVYENQVLQHIEDFSHEDVPVAVGLVIDNSTSMGQKRADVIAAALSFAQSSNPTRSDVCS
jgi:hypothetical protein